MEKLEVKYTEDLRYAEIVKQIYSRLRDNHMYPDFIIITYYPKRYEGKVSYFFDSGGLPDEPELIKILEGINFDELILKKR